MSQSHIQPAGVVQDKPLVSVILPVYNGEDFVNETLESALCQTYRNIEVIVIDDGSTDRTHDVVEARAARDSRVRIIQCTNGGVARARNLGLAAARGEFVAPLDADDLWDPTKIERQVAMMLERGEETGLVYCWWVSIDVNGAVLDRSPGWRIEHDAFEALIQVNYTGNASVPLYRRRCLEQVGGYDEKFREQNGSGCEDWDVALKVAEQNRVAVVPEPLVGYRRRPDSMCHCSKAMWRSQRLVDDALLQRKPNLAPELIRRSGDQFALYLAGVAFWSGAYGRALGWGLRAWRSALLLQVLPYIIGMFSKRLILRGRSRAPVMEPGVRLDRRSIPKPFIPYDRIYARRFRRKKRQATTEPTDEGRVRALPASGSRGRIDACLRSRVWQTAGIALTFLLVAGLHAHNDGLWFQGDAPRHAANGFFWWDLLGMLPADPTEFAVSYYARYPVISPATYPPLFYIPAGFAFYALGPSPHAAKLVVLAFAMLAGIYTMAWARRWIGPRGGWAGAFLAFAPGVVLWTNGVMLNMPATALGLACLYHFRRWMEAGDRKQLVLTAVFMAATPLTYYPAATVLCVCVAWRLVFWRNPQFRPRGLVWVSAAIAIAVVPLAIAVHAAPVLAARHLPTIAFLASPVAWTSYFMELPELLGPVVLTLGLAGIAVGLLVARWRTEAIYLGVWIAALILSHSILPTRDSRYLLLVAPAFILAAAMGLSWAVRLVLRRSERQAAMLVIGLAAGSWSATLVAIPRVSGFREVAAYLQQHAPADAVLYDGYHDGLFGFYARALDPRFERRVVLAEQLLYHHGPGTNFNWVETSKVASIDDAVNILRSQSGCRWIAIEVGPHSEWSAGQRLLRQTVSRPEFELVRSFPVTAVGARRVDLYRVDGPVEPVATVNLSFPSYSNLEFEHVSPITR